MEIQIAIAKINKFASPDSGDTVEFIERPNGGISVVLADAKLNQKSSKALSMKVVHRVVNLIGEGVRDGIAAKAVSSVLFRENAGNVSSSLNILSTDLLTNTLVITRNNPAPVIVLRNGQVSRLSAKSIELGHQENIEPSINEIPLESGTTLIMFTDGVINAGQAQGLSYDLFTTLDALVEEQEPTANEIAEFLLSQAISLDQGKPEDDMCVVVLQTTPHEDNPVLRLIVKIPV